VRACFNGADLHSFAHFLTVAFVQFSPFSLAGEFVPRVTEAPQALELSGILLSDRRPRRL
jgi:hypothetical protein